MYFTEDVRQGIVNQLNDVVNGIAAQLATINTARSETTPTPAYIDPDYDQLCSYQVFVDLDDGEIEDSLRRNAYGLRFKHELTISTVIKDAALNATMRLQTDRYIEAILKCLDGFKVQSSDGDYFVNAVGIERTQNPDHIKLNPFTSKVKFSVNVNKL